MNKVYDSKRAKDGHIYAMKCLFLSFFLFFTSLHLYSSEQQQRTTRVMSDGTTIIHTYDELGKLCQEDLILKSGRHKTTFLDAEEKPKYGVVTTGTGSFGLMYYDKMKSPLFKFWDHGNDDTIIQFYSVNMEPIGKIRMSLSNGERRINWEDEKRQNYIGLAIALSSALIVAIVSFLAGVFISRRCRAK